MKTIVRNDNNVSLYAFDDDKVVQVFDDRIEVGSPIEFIIGDCNAGNVTVFDNMPGLDDWYGWKYLVVNGQWALNPDFVDLRVVGEQSN